MKTHHEELLNAVLDVIESRYAKDVSIMFIYGSYVNGTANEKSDLDMIYVPKTELGWRLARTFMLNGSGNDLWGVNWERLERFANYDDMKVSVIADSRLVYYASEEDKQRYDALKKRAWDTRCGSLTPALVDKAESHLTTAKQYYGELCLGHNLSAAGGVLLEISDVVCLLNHTYLRFGAKRILEEMSALERLPAGFIEAFRAVADVETIEQARAACHTLITLVSGFLSEVEREIVPRPVPAEFAGLYEEISAHWNKIRLSCENGDAINAFLSAASLQDELDRVQRCLGIDITEMRFVDRYNPNSLVEFAQAAQKAEDAFLTLLCDSGVPISSYTTVDQFKHALMDL